MDETSAMILATIASEKFVPLCNLVVFWLVSQDVYLECQFPLVAQVICNSEEIKYYMVEQYMYVCIVKAIIH